MRGKVIKGHFIIIFLFILSYLLQFFDCPPAQCLYGQGGGVVKEKADGHGQVEGGRLETGGNIRISFMHDPLAVLLESVILFHWE